MTTINHEIYCGQDLIALLLKAGFDWQDYFVAHSIDEHFHWEIPLHIAQRWLREVKEYEAQVAYGFDENGNKCYVTECGNKEGDLEDYIEYFPTYEEAQEAVIKKALELILEKGEQKL